MESDFVVGTQTFDFTLNEEKERSTLLAMKNKRQAPQKEGWGLKPKKYNRNPGLLAFLLCDPGWCAQKVKTGAQNRWDGNTHRES